MDTSDINIKSMSDSALLVVMGSFIKKERINQNKSQLRLSAEAGINRSTLSEFEHGKRANILTLIQILRALDKLFVLKDFFIKETLSPLQLATLEQNKRKRASKTQENVVKQKSDW